MSKNIEANVADALFEASVILREVANIVVDELMDDAPDTERDHSSPDVAQMTGIRSPSITIDIADPSESFSGDLARRIP